MVTCYIIDFEAPIIKTLQSYIEKIPNFQVIGHNNNPLSALIQFQETNSYPDITFLDVDMPDFSGIEICSLLKERNKTDIVFTSANTKYAIEAIEMDVTDYLVKPLSYERFLKCVCKINSRVYRVKAKKKSACDFFYIQSESKGKLIKIALLDILYVESQKNYISIATHQKKHLTYLTLSEIEAKLDSSFLRINKSYIINTQKISYMEGNEIFLMNIKEGFMVGPGYKEAFKMHLKEYLVKSKRFHG